MLFSNKGEALLNSKNVIGVSEQNSVPLFPINTQKDNASDLSPVA